MSTLRTFNLQNPDSGTVNIEMDQGGNTLMTGIATVRGAAHFTSTSGSDAVGIGTDITAYKLDVRVTGAEAGLRVYNPDTSSNASGILRLGNDDNQNAAFLRLNSSNNTSAVGGAANLVLGTGTAREVHLATNGTSRLRITSSGNVQVNGGNVHIDDNGEFAIFETDTNLAFTNSSKLCFDFSSNVARIRSSVNGSATIRDIGIFTGNSERLRITSAGDVGIGTAVPVISSGYASLSLAKTNGGQVELKKLSNGRTHYIWCDDNLNLGAAYNGGGGGLIFKTNGNNERLRINGDGRVSIGGVTSPLGALHIHANQGTDTALWIGDSSTNRYLAINEQGSSQNFNHINTRYNDNAIHAHYILDNPYAQGTGYGSQILFRGNNQGTTAYIETSNEASGSARGTLRLRGADNHGLDVRSTGEVTTTHASNIGYETNAATNTRSLVHTSLDAQKYATSTADWFILKTFHPNKSGRVNIHADMFISSGTYYFSFRVREEGTNTIVFNAGDNGGFGTYENPSGQSGNVHSYKTYKWICPLIKAHKRYYIEMAATNAAGTSVNANASQEVFLKNLYIYSMSGGHSDSTGSMSIQQGHDVSSSSNYGGTTRAVMSSTINRDSLNSIQHFAGTESTFLGWFTSRAYNRYLDFELNLSGSYMWFAQAYGYLYSRGQVAGSMISGYTYTGNTILNKYSHTFGNRGWYGSYRTSGGNLCLKFDSGGNGYSEGRIALFLGTHGPTNPDWRVLQYRQNDTTNNIF